MKVYVLTEAAEILRCSPRKVREEAARHGIGANLGGRAGWRLTEDDITALLKAMTSPPAPRRRRRRTQ